MGWAVLGVGGRGWAILGMGGPGMFSIEVGRPATQGWYPQLSGGSKQGFPTFEPQHTHTPRGGAGGVERGADENFRPGH